MMPGDGQGGNMTAGTGQAAAGAAARPATQRRFTTEQKRGLVQAYEAFEGAMDAFCAQHHVSSTSLCAWRKAFRAHGSSGLEPGAGGVAATRGHRPGPYTPAERQQAVEAFQKSGMALEAFAKVWKVTPRILRGWIRRYELGGAAGLLNAGGGERRGHPALSTLVTEQIVAVKRSFPTFGLKRVRAFLGRFRGVKVSVGSVRKATTAAGLPPARTAKGKRKKAIRFFERARPGQLWQSDWTSLVLPRTQQRVYLIAFLDDHSRYVVSWGLHLGQRTEHVVECLREGMARFGKPLEVLTDQGPQYFAWRGTSEFQVFLKSQGIRHSVARSHHPQTLGKCERFWGTVQEEFWGRTNPVDLEDARARFAHFVAHYNHFRPHQGIGNLVPADRFFGASDPVRASVEAAYAANELHLAVGEAPRTPVYLTGQIGNQAVSLVGEGGKLVFQTAGGTRHELAYETLGMASGATATKEEADGGRERGDGSGDGERDGGGPGAGGEAGAGGQAEGDVQAAAAGGAGEGAAVARESGRAAAGARNGDGDSGDMARAQDTGGSGEGAGDSGGAVEAAGGRGAVGDGGGAIEAAQADAEGGPAAGGGSGEAAETDRGAGAGAGDADRSGGSAQGPAGEQGAGA
jgi:transposase InsO family protein/transposase-like protein